MAVYKKVLLLIVLWLCAMADVLAQCTLTVNVTATNNGVICSGNSIVLTATPKDGTAPYSYVWSTGETTASITVNRGDTYSVTVTDNTDGCQPVSQSITVVETPGPGTPVASGAVVCSDTQATLTATGQNGTYSWYDAPTGGNLLGTGSTFVTPTIHQNTVFYVDASLNGCTGPRTAVLVELSGAPQTAGAQICAGNTAVLRAFGGSAYNWYDKPGGTILGTGDTFTTPPLTTTTTYYVVAVINGCASAATPVGVTVVPYPQSPVAEPVTVCNGSVANLHATANGLIDWFDVPAGGTSLITSQDYTTPKLTATTTYYVQNTVNGCSSPRVAVVVTVNAIPDAPTAQGGTVCRGTSATLTASSTIGGTFRWYTDAAGSNLVFTGNPYQTPPLNANTTYYVQTLNGDCASTLTAVQANITPAPSTPTASVTPVCKNSPSVLKAVSPGGDYVWYDAQTGGNLLATGDTYTTPPLTANTTYYLQTTVNGCVSARAAVTATIVPPLTPPTAANATVCEGSSATLFASGANNYQWYDAATGGNLLTAGQVFVTPALTASTTYYVQTTVNGCESDRSAVTVTVNPTPPQPVVPDAHICPGSTATLTASVPPGGSVTWYDAEFGGGVMATGNTFITPTLYASTTYYVEYTVGSCVSGRKAVTVTTEPILYPQFTYTSGTFCTTGPHAIPVINDTNGGVFSAPSGLKFVSTTTGEIDVAASLPGKYIVKFVGNEACHGVTETEISIVLVPKANFSYAGPFCQYATTNAKPNFPTGASAGTYTASPAGLVFLDETTGVIDLKNSLPGTYTVTNTIPEDGSCPETSASSTVTINPGVSIYAGPNQTVKAGTPVQLAGVVSGVPGGKWTGGGGTFSSATVKDAIYTPATGETNVVLTFTSDTPPGNCGAKSSQVRITIVPKPTAPTAAAASTCFGSKATLSATAPGGSYAWFDAPIGGNQVGTGANFTTPALAASTTYYVQTTISVNTSDRTAVPVTVSGIPQPPTASTVKVCENTPATLTTQGSTGNYQWFNTATGGTVLGTGSTYTTPPMQSNFSYYVQAVAGDCASARTKVDIEVTPVPVITSAATGDVCSGNAFTYNITSSAPSATFSWERPSVNGISNPAVPDHAAGSIAETLINTTTAPINVTYNIKATSNGCSTVLQYVLTVNPAAAITSAPGVKVCNVNPLNYEVTFGAPVTEFSWSRAAVPGIINAAVTGQAATTIKEVLQNATNLPIDVPYTFTYTSGNCVNTFKFTATVNPSIAITSADRVGACSGRLFTYEIKSSVAATTYNWSRGAVPGISNPAVNNQTSSVISETLVNTTNSPINVVYLIYPSAYGCAAPLYPVVVTVYPVPQTSVANSNSPVCINHTITLRTPAVAGASYQWTGPNGFTSTQQNVDIPNATHANAGTYTLLVIVNGCASEPATTDVQINDPATVSAGPDQTVCITQSEVVLAGAVGGGTSTGIWTSTGNGTFSPSIDALNAHYIPTEADKTAGSVILTLKSTSKDDCDPASDQLTITFAPTPAVDAGTDMEVCSQNTAVPLAGKLLKAGAINWTSSGTGTFNSPNSLTANYLPSAADIAGGSVTLTLHFTNATVCDIESDQIVIKFIPPPTVDAGEKRYVLKGNTITLRPTVSDPNVTYLWTPNIGLSDNTVKNPILTGDVDRTYTLTVTDVRGCVSTDKVDVSVSPLITINNTFTPNGDGVNDLWNITGLIAYVKATVDVFDRYGAQVYHSLGYDLAWDGNLNGRQLPAGTYYYIVRLNVDGKVLSGPVTIIR